MRLAAALDAALDRLESMREAATTCAKYVLDRAVDDADIAAAMKIQQEYKPMANNDHLPPRPESITLPITAEQWKQLFNGEEVVFNDGGPIIITLKVKEPADE
jgi:hypothetical protein